MYLDGAASCLIPIIRAYSGTTGHLIEQATCREREGHMEDLSASEILHLSSVNERRDGDRYSDLDERKHFSLSLGVYDEKSKKWLT